MRKISFIPTQKLIACFLVAALIVFLWFSPSSPIFERHSDVNFAQNYFPIIFCPHFFAVVISPFAPYIIVWTEYHSWVLCPKPYLTKIELREIFGWISIKKHFEVTACSSFTVEVWRHLNNKFCAWFWSSQRLFAVDWKKTSFPPATHVRSLLLFFLSFFPSYKMVDLSCEQFFLVYFWYSIKRWYNMVQNDISPSLLTYDNLLSA